MGNARGVDARRTDAGSDSELAALAAVYRYVLDCHARKAAEPTAGPDGRDDAKEANGNVGSDRYAK